jgi:hypothetical protein
MNDKDKEAFEEWFAQNPVNKLEAEEAWQAACEYRQKDIDGIKEKLQSENAKLRECAEWYSNIGLADGYVKNLLKELGE